MIQFKKGDIFESDATALVNTVNTVGIMGKGIALQFKKRFPNNYKVYREAWKNKELAIGKLLVVEDESLLKGKQYIINFPTKTTWKKPSEYEYIEKGLNELVKILPNYPIQSIAIPPLGSGNGGLNWNNVKEIIISKLNGLDIEVTVYEPSTKIKEELKKERVKLTEARAMLLFMLYQLVKNGEFVSEFSSEKICYFLQKFGAEKYFRLKYQPNFYGPYSGKARYLLNVLNGSYLMGYNGMDKKPFEELILVPDGEKDVKEFLNRNPEIKEIAYRANKFLSGFYSDFGLELLSTIDFISQEKNSFDREVVKAELEKWSDRKRTLFSNDDYLDIALGHLQQAQFVRN
ncbi:type II toxin-antitoxin system antitoxin DNA ADP-ribosyl glycohydrolase DarG [Ulvibacterium marinum]|uniref:Appr-1-p processing protein n=1 Tax=Ulvibacterium marinum TaxID=2419782 RepID=A0A3B0CAQ3_9FLAO|nr:macro domain-containing protein [Ulvibacterium marinum]RKN82853.1 Appr-1-p processing protein [Ulvibacterium marinum]